jgi:hypothetical protein
MEPASSSSFERGGLNAPDGLLGAALLGLIFAAAFVTPVGITAAC